MSNGLILVSGATGFVGTAVTRALVEAGYAVRGTSRSQSKADQWAKFNPDHADKVEWSIVPDGAASHAYDDAVKGVDYIVHTASPFHFNIKDKEKDMLIPAVEGTKNMLSAAKKEPRVKHMVLTSSYAAMVDLAKMPAIGKTYTGEDWNPVTWEQAITVDNAAFTYAASKTFAEKVAWDDTERIFPVTAICPSMIFGPAYQPIDSIASLNTSILGIHGLMNNNPSPPTYVPVGIDVRDVATLHVNALNSPPPAGSPKNAQRFLTAAWDFFNHEITDTLLTSPRLSKDTTGVDLTTRVSRDRSQDPVYEHFASYAEPAKALLGRPFIAKEQCFIDSVLRLLELEKQF